MSGKGPRIALVGFGAVARRHLEVFRALGAEVPASCNRSPQGRARARDEGGIERTYADPLEMVARERPDCLLVTASALSISGLMKSLIPCERPILVEKPPGTLLTETQELATLAARHKVAVMVGLNRRFYSVFHQALARLGGREAFTSVSVDWSEDPGHVLERGHPPELLPRLNFANSLHGIDLLTFLGGEASSRSAWGRNLDPSRKELRWQMGFEGLSGQGVRLRFHSTWDAPGMWSLAVDAPGARWSSSPLESAVVHVRGRAPEALDPSEEDRRFKPGFFDQARAFLDVVREGVPVTWPATSLQEVLPSVAIAAELTRACAEG